MRKIVITLACLCALCISTCAAFAAQDECIVYVGGEKMTVSKDGTADTYTCPTGGEAKLWYDVTGDGLVLEIKDLKLEDEGIRTEHPMTLVIKGKNRFDVGDSSSKLYGIYAKGGLTVSEESDGNLSIIAGEALQACFGIYSEGDIVINGGKLDVRAGKAKLNESIGIYSEKIVKINGGVVKAYGGEAAKDISSGIGGFNGIEILGGEVTAVGGLGSYSIGLYSYLDMRIGGDAVVKAKSGEGDVKIYSYGTFVYGDLFVADRADFTSVAGAVNDDVINKEKRSGGIFLGEDVTGDEGEAAAKINVFKVTGGEVTAESLDDDGYDVMLYDAVFVDERQVAGSGSEAYGGSVENGSPDTGDDGLSLFAVVVMMLAVMTMVVATRQRVN